jgi:hypothetical protein
MRNWLYFLSTCKIHLTRCCQKLKVGPIYSKKAEHIYIYIYMVSEAVLIHYSHGQKVEKVISEIVLFLSDGKSS